MTPNDGGPPGKAAPNNGSRARIVLDPRVGFARPAAPAQRHTFALPVVTEIPVSRNGSTAVRP
jgi:hypothetical protein